MFLKYIGKLFYGQQMLSKSEALKLPQNISGQADAIKK